MIYQLAAIAVICITVVVLAEQIRRYYTTKNEYEYKQARLEYDDLILADGGEEDHDD